MLCHIENNVPNSKEAVKGVRDIITQTKDGEYNEEVLVYNTMCDLIVLHAMKNPKNFDKSNKDKPVIEMKEEKMEEVIKEGCRKTTEEEVKVLMYLNRLRDTATINMLGATPYLISEFGFDKREARVFLALWMDNFDEDGNYSQVIDK
jgi:hypothetical protein